MAEVRADHIQLIFIREIGKQASWAMRAANDLNGAQAELCLLKDKIAQGGKLEAALLKRNVDDVFRLVEIFLYHVGRISLLLWNKKREDRGKALRQLLEIGDESPLKARDARNHLAHFDEELDDWAKRTGGKVYIDGNVGDLNPNAAGNPEVLRHYEPRTAR